jgi:hypothetical protein
MRFPKRREVRFENRAGYLCLSQEEFGRTSEIRLTYAQALQLAGYIDSAQEAIEIWTVTAEPAK